jgi:hypothetical protein
MIDLAGLKTEITNDPQALRFAPLVASGAHADIARKLNEIRQVVNVSSGVVPAYEIFECIDPTEFAALSAVLRTYLQMMLSMGHVDLGGPNTKAAFQMMFAPGTATRTALTAKFTRKGSRCEQLWGPGCAVDHVTVSEALSQK